jgi:hypothetical protein
MAEEEGFEPPRGMTRLSVFKTDPFSRTWVFLHFKNIAAEGDRTPDLTGMNTANYKHKIMELSGIEPLTSCVQSRRSPS